MRLPAGDHMPRRTSDPRLSLRAVYMRMVADRRFETGSITAGQPSPAVEDVGLLDGRGGVEAATGAVEEPVDDVPVLGLGRGFIECRQATPRHDERHSIALYEDLFDVGPAQDVGEWTI